MKNGLLNKIKKYWLELFFGFLILDMFFCAIGFLHKEIPIEYHGLKQAAITWEDESLSAYLEKIWKIPKCTIIMTGSELNKELLDEKALEILKSMELKCDQTALIDESKNLLEALWINGKFVDGGVYDQAPYPFGSYVNQHYVCVEPQAFGSGKIYIDDSLCSKQSSGLNIVVMDNENHCLLDSVNYQYVNGKIIISR